MTIQLNRRGFLATLTSVAMCKAAKAVEPPQIGYKPGLHMIPIGLLKRNRDRRQPNWECHHLDRFVKSVKAEGVLVPILADESLLVIDGAYRMEAAKLSGLKEVPVQVLRMSSVDRLECEILCR